MNKELLNGIPNRNFQQETLDKIYEAEKIGIDCTALKQHILKVEAMGFEPKEHVLFEQD